MSTADKFKTIFDTLSNNQKIELTAIFYQSNKDSKSTLDEAKIAEIAKIQAELSKLLKESEILSNLPPKPYDTSIKFPDDSITLTGIDGLCQVPPIL